MVNKKIEDLYTRLDRLEKLLDCNWTDYFDEYFRDTATKKDIQIFEGAKNHPSVVVTDEERANFWFNLMSHRVNRIIHVHKFASKAKEKAFER